MALFNPHQSVLEASMQIGEGDRPKKASHPKTLRSGHILLSPDNLVHPNSQPVDSKIYGGFLEHLGRCIYGGLVDDPKQPNPASVLEHQDGLKMYGEGGLGFRKDVMDVLGKDGELEIPLLRWPGGNFVSNYHWQDGIGPYADRPKRVELAWHGVESNLFGTDEFIQYCRKTGCEPYICLNMGTGSYEEALAWLEYCNGTEDTTWANLRRKHTGVNEPHNVRYWGLGNEMFGPWQIGFMNPTAYAIKAKMWAHGLKLLDPSIELVSCGCTGGTDWDREILSTLLPFVDMHSIHNYTMFGHDREMPYESNVFSPAGAEREIEICKSLIDMVNHDRVQQQMPARIIKIAFDEWNVWDEKKATSKNGLTQVYDYADALGFIAWLNVLVRQHKDLGLACLAQSVNVLSPLLTTPEGVLRQTTFYPLKLFSKYMKGGRLLQLPSFPDRYLGPTSPTWIQQTEMQPAYIDAVAMMIGDTDIRISILNRHPTADWTTKIDFAGFDINTVEVHELYSEDMGATNTFEYPDKVIPEVQKYDANAWKEIVKGGWIVRKHSWSFLLIRGSLSK